MNRTDGVSPRQIPVLRAAKIGDLREELQRVAASQQQLVNAHQRELQEIVDVYGQATQRKEEAEQSCHSYVERTARQLLHAAMEVGRQTLSTDESEASAVAEAQRQLSLEREKIQKLIDQLNDEKSRIAHIHKQLSLNASSTDRLKKDATAEYAAVSPAEARMLRRRQAALDSIAYASKGSASVLAATWQQELKQLRQAVDGEFAIKVKSMKPVRDQLAKYSEIARSRARRMAGQLAEDAGAAYDEHLGGVMTAIDDTIKKSRRAQKEREPATARGPADKLSGLSTPRMSSIEMEGVSSMTANEAVKLRTNGLHAWQNMVGFSEEALDDMLRSTTYQTVTMLPAKALEKTRAFVQLQEAKLTSQLHVRELAEQVLGFKTSLNRASVSSTVRGKAGALDSSGASAPKKPEQPSAAGGLASMSIIAAATPVFQSLHAAVQLHISRFGESPDVAGLEAAMADFC